ncbi:hypothetical protein L228DRAFT_270509 [Xylona heveae TC161]|uniref:Uncharacterized protein n=1 Tax=Xylona heveae (strain CBS 132557 / TC161) TaxID=1328760 RepID=A0A165AGK7_XYLHT|nr:hypothetical protein L228DRAFT_270509 [Xylona heveae TC161]KZF20438.1 hypothetical protein L228DRAFT_270509 [Xylona heveae TC161]
MAHHSRIAVPPSGSRVRAEHVGQRVSSSPFQPSMCTLERSPARSFKTNGRRFASSPPVVLPPAPPSSPATFLHASTMTPAAVAVDWPAQQELLSSPTRSRTSTASSRTVIPDTPRTPPPPTSSSTTTDHSPCASENTLIGLYRSSTESVGRDSLCTPPRRVLRYSEDTACQYTPISIGAGALSPYHRNCATDNLTQLQQARTPPHEFRAYAEVPRHASPRSHKKKSDPLSGTKQIKSDKLERPDFPPRKDSLPSQIFPPELAATEQCSAGPRLTVWPQLPNYPDPRPAPLPPPNPNERSFFEDDVSVRCFGASDSMRKFKRCFSSRSNNGQGKKKTSRTFSTVFCCGEADE